MSPSDRRLESAIPRHLQVARTTRSLCPRGFDPPYPTFVARFGEHVTQFVILYSGIQSARPADPAAMAPMTAARDQVLRWLRLPDGPRFFDEATFTDEAGYANTLFACYWDDASSAKRWSRTGEAAAWWASEDRLQDGVGYYREQFSPQAARMETHFQEHRPEGIAVLAPRMSGEIQEHAYWGGARDRIPIAQTETLDPGRPVAFDVVALDTTRRRIRLAVHDNLYLIRSGQDWTDADAAEKALYDRDILPHLETGMAFLRDAGGDVGCLESRFVQCVDAGGAAIGKSYGMSIWRSLADLERWAASHPTHLAIFDAGGAYMKKLGSDAGLRTYHEICVLRSDGQDFEYVGCHPRTGMLKSARSR